MKIYDAVIVGDSQMAKAYLKILHRNKRHALHVTEESFDDFTVLHNGEMRLDGTKFKSKTLIVAPNPSLHIPAINGLGGSNYHISLATITGLSSKPDHVAVLGAGPSGVSASIFLNSLGIHVQLIEHKKRILPSFDPSVSEYVRRILEKKTVAVWEDTDILTVGSGDEKTFLIGEHKTKPMRTITNSLLLTTGQVYPQILNPELKIRNVRIIHADQTPVSFSTMYRNLKITRKAPADPIYHELTTPSLYAFSCGIDEEELTKAKMGYIKGVAVMNISGVNDGFVKLLTSVRQRVVGASFVSTMDHDGLATLLLESVRIKANPKDMLAMLHPEHDSHQAVAEAIEKIVL